MGLGRRFFQSTIKQANPFISTWRTSNTSTGSSNSDQVKLPLVSSGKYNFSVDWGDGNSDTITVWNQAETTHTYASSGNYTITITGLIRGWQFANTGDRLKITDILQWGNIRFTSQTDVNLGAFRGCANLNVSATDIPIIDIQRLAGFFRACTILTGNTSFNNWDMMSVNDFTGMFRDAVNFNQNIGSWDVSSVTNFSSMFSGASSFNQNIGGWNVGNATTFNGMFFNTSSFNQDIGGWDVSKCTNFSAMFSGASSFNQNIGGWNVGNATTFSSMFVIAIAFNQDIGGWDVSKCTNFSGMFNNATAFNQDIGGWNVSLGTNFTNFMSNKTAANYSAANLDSIYNGWSSLTLVSGRTISFNTIKYTAAGQAGRDILTGAPNNWTITDGGT